MIAKYKQQAVSHLSTEESASEDPLGAHCLMVYFNLSLDMACELSSDHNVTIM